VRWVAAKGRGMFDEAGVCVRAIGTAIDVTSRRKAEERLRESEGFTRLLLNSATEAFYSVDTQGFTTLCNQAFLGLLGFDSVDEVVGRKLHDVIHHTHPDGTRYDVKDCPIYCAAATGASPVVVSDEFFFRKDGSSFPVEYRAAPIFDHGDLKGAICTFVDISERRRADEQRELLLHELDHRVKNLFAVARSIVTMSARSAASLVEMTTAVLGRLSALAKAHAMARPMSPSDLNVTQTVTLKHLLDVLTQPHVNDDKPAPSRVVLEGPEVPVSGEAITTLSLVFHELATNAAKYGGLSTPEGNLHVAWERVEDSLHLVWTESGGPTISGAPDVKGFGSRLSERSVTSQLNGTISLDWQRPRGLCVTMKIPFERLAL
jgi:PAS domain S-box-containing protein